MKNPRTKAAHEARKRSSATSVVAPETKAETQAPVTPSVVPAQNAGVAAPDGDASAFAKATARSGPGRPTKLTPELIERVCRYLRAGSFIESAALGCGITRQTFYAWMRAGHAARDDRLAHCQRGPGAGEFVFTPEEERCVEFLDAMEEALSVAENRWVCGIVEAGERDWRAWAWRADRRTRLPHGYRACGEWDVGANESTLSGIKERNAARVEWKRKMDARVAAADAAASAENSEVIAEARKSGNAEPVAKGCGEIAETKGPEHQTTENSEVIAKARKSESAEGSNGSTKAGATKVGSGPGVVSKVIRPGGLMASVVLLLGLWLSPFDAGSARAQGSFAEPQEGGQGCGDPDGLRGWANESGFQPWGFGRPRSLTMDFTDGHGWSSAVAHSTSLRAMARQDGESR